MHLTFLCSAITDTKSLALISYIYNCISCSRFLWLTYALVGLVLFGLG